MSAVLGAVLLVACCVSQYVRGRLWRYDAYGQAGFDESTALALAARRFEEDRGW